MNAAPHLRILAWDHPRATRPLHACAAEWNRRTGVRVEVVTRSLGAFGDDVPAQAAADVVLIDHPHIGIAADQGSILALDDLVPADIRADVEHGSVGGSQSTYSYRGATWALAIDGACQALAFNPEQAGGGQAPTTWAEVIRLSKDRPGSVVLPLHPAHAISALLSILAGHGITLDGLNLGPQDVLVEVVATLSHIATAGDRAALDWEPPEVLERLAKGEFVCVPLTYSYVGYEVEWHSAPSVLPGGRPGSILGGVGAAVLSDTPDPEGAAAFAGWLATRSTQLDLVLPNGGQPASRAARSKPGFDPMFPAVLSTIEVAAARPNFPWWPDFQLAAGDILNKGFANGATAHELADQVSAAHLSHREDTL